MTAGCRGQHSMTTRRATGCGNTRADTPKSSLVLDSLNAFSLQPLAFSECGEQLAPSKGLFFRKREFSRNVKSFGIRTHRQHDRKRTVTRGLFIRPEPKPGKDADVEKLLRAT